MSAYMDDVLRMMGPARSDPCDPGVWQDLESRIGFAFPADYRTVIDCYAPVQVNGHLFLPHPATERWNLGDFIDRTIASFRGLEMRSAGTSGGAHETVLCGLPDDFVPILSTDRGEVLFMVSGAGGSPQRMVAFDRHEVELVDYFMSFAEWLYRYYSGEEMFGWDSSACYPGPLMFESLPMTPDERSTVWYGPSRDM